MDPLRTRILTLAAGFATASKANDESARALEQALEGLPEGDRAELSVRLKLARSHALANAYHEAAESIAGLVTRH